MMKILAAFLLIVPFLAACAPVAPIEQTMGFVGAGEFTMGYDGLSETHPQHVPFLDTFSIDKYEVTNAHYKKCVDAGACPRPSETKSDTRASYYGNSQYDNYPVIYVSWNDANAFCSWAGKRLPTEAEWEKAARDKSGRTYPWFGSYDQNWLNSREGGKGDTAAVGSYPLGASPYDLMDMAGNVLEWVADWYDSDYYASSPVMNPKGAAMGQARVVRGGAWATPSSFARTYSRDGRPPSESNSEIGFRCAR